MNEGRGLALRGQGFGIGKARLGLTLGRQDFWESEVRVLELKSQGFGIEKERVLMENTFFWD